MHLGDREPVSRDADEADDPFLPRLHGGPQRAVVAQARSHSAGWTRLWSWNSGSTTSTRPRATASPSPARPWLREHRWRVLPRDQDRRALLPAARERSAARSTGWRSTRRPDPAPQPRPSRRVATALSDDGALPAAIEARDEGLVRFIGVTGHGLTVAEMHRRSLDRFPFDSVLLPYSTWSWRTPGTPQTSSDCWRCAGSGMSPSRRSRRSLGALGDERAFGRDVVRAPREQGEIDLAVSWVFGEPGVFLNSVGDIELLPRVLDAAERFTSRPERTEMDRLRSDLKLSSLFV